MLVINQVQLTLTTVNHRLLLTKLYGMIEDTEFTKLIGSMMSNVQLTLSTVNHRLLLTKLSGMTEDAEFTKLIGSMMSNRRFYVELNGKKNK